MKKKVMVAMSGGVDSSVAACLLVRQGYDVAGVTMSLGVNARGTKKQACCGPREIDDARHVCRVLSISHHVVDLSTVLQRKVITNFIDEYLSGRTPNPCVQCNRYLKFGALFEWASAMGYECLATGHYAARGIYRKQRVLKQPKDTKKDQTYFLYGIPRNVLGRILMPLGQYTKEEVRHLAHEAHLPVAEKPQSQDICFIPGKDYGAFLLSHGYPGKPGDIVDEHGKILGRHKGIVNYTIGQRGGLGITSARGLYVRDIDAQHNRLVVCERERLAAAGLIAGQVNVHVDVLPCRARVKIRYGHPAVAASVAAEPGGIKIIFDTPQESVTPGQSAVLYAGKSLLGGGIIERVIRTDHA